VNSIISEDLLEIDSSNGKKLPQYQYYYVISHAKEFIPNQES
jgi:hypothetical protein